MLGYLKWLEMVSEGVMGATSCFVVPVPQSRIAEFIDGDLTKLREKLEEVVQFISKIKPMKADTLIYDKHRLPGL